jgi:hypothetical protein
LYLGIVCADVGAAFPEEPVMARYFFHVSDGTLVLDDVGVELPDVTSAQTTAIQLTAEILKDGMLGPLWNELCWRVEVTDSPQAGGQRFFVVNFSITSYCSAKSA